MTTPVTTKPCPSDQSAPLVPGNSALADLAIEFGVSTDCVEAYQAHQAAFRAAPHRLVATVVALQAGAL